MRLKQQFFLLFIAVVGAVVAGAWWMTGRIVAEVDARWASQFVQRQVQFDKYRVLTPLLREIALARQLAVEPAIIAMAAHEDDPRIRREAFTVLERYRANFSDRSYFFALVSSGSYYFNDAEGQYTGRELRYRLVPQQPNDQWFYATLQRGDPYQINLSHDANLGVTKVWVNVPVMGENGPLGMIGTAFGIEAFLKETVAFRQDGISNIFIDGDMAVQLYRDASMIDYASITKKAQQRKRVDAILTRPADIAELGAAMARLKRAPESIETLAVELDGKPYLLGVAYVEELGWYDLTLIDTRNLFQLNNFFRLPLAISGILLLALFACGLLLNRAILRPLAQLSEAAGAVEVGRFAAVDALPAGGKDEVGAVLRSFRHMAQTVQRQRAELEARVAERTTELERTARALQESNESLHRLSRTDALTQVSNRFDLMHRLEVEESRARRNRLPCAVIMLDIDHFKHFNDQYGHDVGDRVLTLVAGCLRELLRSEDVVGRWGGEEFLIILPGNDEAASALVAERIRLAVAALDLQQNREALHITVSQGVAVFQPGQHASLRTAVRLADEALYLAKGQGRNCVVSV